MKADLETAKEQVVEAQSTLKKTLAELKELISQTQLTQARDSF